MVYLSRIYTKSGDAGETGLGDGTRVPKDAPRVEAFGEVDELNAVLGLVAANCPDCPEAALLRAIQNDLFDVGADLCVPPTDERRAGEVPARDGGAGRAAGEGDRPAERAAAAAEELHPARRHARGGVAAPGADRLPPGRAAVVTLMRTEPVNPQVLIYLNRLSDFLFVLARVANDGGKGDVLWVPGGTDSR